VDVSYGEGWPTWFGSDFEFGFDYEIPDSEIDDIFNYRSGVDDDDFKRSVKSKPRSKIKNNTLLLLKKSIEIERLIFFLPDLQGVIVENLDWLIQNLTPNHEYAFFSRNKTASSQTLSRSQWDRIQLEWTKMANYYSGFFDVNWRLVSITEDRETIHNNLKEFFIKLNGLVKNEDVFCEYMRRPIISRNRRIMDFNTYPCLQDCLSENINKKDSYFLITYAKQTLKNLGLRYGNSVIRPSIGKNGNSDVIIPDYQERKIDERSKPIEVWKTHQIKNPFPYDNTYNVFFEREMNPKEWGIPKVKSKKSKENFFYWKKSLKYNCKDDEFENYPKADLEIFIKKVEAHRSSRRDHNDECKVRSLRFEVPVKINSEYDRISFTSSRASNISKRLDDGQKEKSIEILKKIKSVIGKFKRPSSCCFKKLKNQVEFKLSYKKAVLDIFDNVDEKIAYEGIAWALKRHPELLFD